MDDTLLSTDLPGDWTDMLAHFDGNESGSTAQFESMISRGAFKSNDSFETPLGQTNEQFSQSTTMSQFDELDRILGVQPVGAGNDAPGLSTLPTDRAQDSFSLPLTSSTTDQEQSDTSAKPNSAEAHSPYSEPHPTLEKSVEVKQLRQKYHEKYKERNRLAAGKSRQKQVDLIALLEAERRDEERRRRALEDEIRKIQKDLLAIKQELHSHIRLSNCINMMSQGARLQTLGLLAQDILR
uniref:BZIP transcription factor n=1 Tax=Aspergillus westerdijkiae TaxID=357447 RepID=A0A2I7UGH8_9EURO|nr:bZIP transcription factor [Aspergillus westerdijkiae]